MTNAEAQIRTLQGRIESLEHRLSRCTDSSGYLQSTWRATIKYHREAIRRLSDAEAAKVCPAFRSGITGP